MKKAVKVTALSLALAFTSSLAMATENIAFVSGDYLFQNHPDRKMITEKLEAEFKPRVEKLAANKKDIDGKIAASQKKVEAKIAALQKDAPKLRSADIKKREEEINKLGNSEQETLNKLVSAHDEEVRKYQEDYAKRDKEETDKLVNSIQNAVNNVAKAKNYTLVLNEGAVVFAADAKNITEEVLKSIPATQAK
ncbi:TPA: OmpH family outer membrane protein [Pasteurella multocida]|uniref:Outer membrane protein n=1 Tax=Pasteurella dagmatis ATCC 43325 TaxID=667128 RepID=C9PNE0_9PAST|nr:OmpH family outer membrane protein [Pasteurella dagmatis]EEX50927.1 outer membrane protein [Pasteurella dagmatis ATCC 43325]SNV73238.1 outer membrane p25 [Pasteurella dagmatis]VEI58341.1 outer membrane p25 [Pasteurella multocida]HDR1022090.1 OmpH family outer membrane protein [Pasteurella multocida]